MKKAKFLEAFHIGILFQQRLKYKKKLQEIESQLTSSGFEILETKYGLIPGRRYLIENQRMKEVVTFREIDVLQTPSNEIKILVRFQSGRTEIPVYTGDFDLCLVSYREV